MQKFLSRSSRHQSQCVRIERGVDNCTAVRHCSGFVLAVPAKMLFPPSPTSQQQQLLVKDTHTPPARRLTPASVCGRGGVSRPRSTVRSIKQPKSTSRLSSPNVRVAADRKSSAALRTGPERERGKKWREREIKGGGEESNSVSMHYIHD